VVRIHVPALRERIGDLEDLCHHFMQKIAPDHSIVLDPLELRTMSEYDWPGNVRELRNVIERAILVRQDHRIHPSHLLQNNGAAACAGTNNNGKLSGSDSAIMTLKELEADHICRTLERLDNNYTHTAKALGVSRSTLMRKIKSLKTGHCLKTGHPE
jgi:transcriptional regulator with PAS, ATPase and Fis domain